MRELWGADYNIELENEGREKSKMAYFPFWKLFARTLLRKYFFRELPWYLANLRVEFYQFENFLFFYIGTVAAAVVPLYSKVNNRFFRLAFSNEIKKKNAVILQPKAYLL